MDDSEQRRRALDGVRVLDLTHQVAGPSSTLMLAFLGAEVVKVIAPGSRDSYDAVPFYLNNASKKSVELDLGARPAWRPRCGWRSGRTFSWRTSRLA